MIVPVIMPAEECKVNNDKAWCLSNCIGIMDKDSLSTWNINLSDELIKFACSPEQLVAVCLFEVILNF